MYATPFLLRIGISLLILFSLAACKPEAPLDCSTPYEAPQLTFTEIEEFQTGSRTFIRYHLPIRNFFTYPDAYFELAPELPACARGVESVRSWLELYNGEDKLLQTYCTQTDPTDLLDVSLTYEKGISPPAEIYARIHDRSCENAFVSPKIDIRCIPDIAPELALVDIESETISDITYTRYSLSIRNHAAYPDALFTAALDLGACGGNPKPSRTWVRVFDENGEYLYGFCGLGEANQLDVLGVSVRADRPQPKRLYLTLSDRRCELEIQSNWVDI